MDGRPRPPRRSATGKPARAAPRCHRRPHRPRHGQRETRPAAERHGRLPHQAHQRSATGPGHPQVDRLRLLHSSAPEVTSLNSGGQDFSLPVMDATKACGWPPTSRIWQGSPEHAARPWPRIARPSPGPRRRRSDRPHRACSPPAWRHPLLWRTQLRAACQHSETLLKQGPLPTPARRWKNWTRPSSICRPRPRARSSGLVLEQPHCSAASRRSVRRTPTPSSRTGRLPRPVGLLQQAPITVEIATGALLLQGGLGEVVEFDLDEGPLGR